MATVDDGAGPYLERFLPGAFREQVKEARTAPLRIWLNLAHRRKAVIGHATGLTERDGGLYGTFAVHPGATGDQVLAAICDGLLVGVSMQATPLRSREIDGVTFRRQGCAESPSFPTPPIGTRRCWVSAKRYAASRRAPPHPWKPPCGNWSGSTGSCEHSPAPIWTMSWRCERSSVGRPGPAAPT